MKHFILILLILVSVSGCGNSLANNEQEKELENHLNEYLIAYETFDFDTLEILKEEITTMLNNLEFRDNTNEVIHGFINSIYQSKELGIEHYKEFLRAEVPKDYEGIFHETLLKHKDEVS